MTAFSYKKTRKEVLRKRFLEQEKYLKKLKKSGKLSACVIYPNSYKVGMSNLGFHVLFKILNEMPDVYCDRAFYDENLCEPGFSFERNLRLKEYDVLLFTISFELDYLNALILLEKGGIPIKREDRGENLPFVIFGGVVPTANPEPIADFADIVFIGEAEACFSKTLDYIINSKTVGKPRSLILNEIAGRDGIYIPRFYREAFHKDKLISFDPLIGTLSKKIERVYLDELDSKPATSAIITQNTEMSNMFLIELNRGCPAGCQFCLARACYKPYRNLSKEKVLENITDKDILKITKRIGLVGTSIADYPYLEDVLSRMSGKGLDVRFSSVRGDALSIKALKLIQRLGHTSITTAPETGDDELRLKLNKKITNDEFFEFFRGVDEVGFDSLKLYFMFGIDDDLDSEITSILDFISSTCEYFTRHIIVSISNFIPKPHTGFALFRTHNSKSIKKKLKNLEKSIFKTRVRDVRIESVRFSEIQKYLSLGDRRVVKYLQRAVKWGKYPGLTDEDIKQVSEFGDILPWDFINIDGVPQKPLKNGG
jgi:radical SAM superfamily enzyme YgiQ (UPF0313 family)